MTGENFQAESSPSQKAGGKGMCPESLRLSEHPWVNNSHATARVTLQGGGTRLLPCNSVLRRRVKACSDRPLVVSGGFCLERSVLKCVILCFLQ